MTGRRIVPTDVSKVQIAASDPARSVWVAANAGSGKTHVLAQRVIRLLLQGSEPSRILCITFTKAAAANMQNRVFERLSEWIALDDAALDEAIRSISNETPDAALRDRARRLFALALETPGGLKVQTIHAFCTHLLHLFPFEANVAARFTVLDDASESQLLDNLTLDVLQSAAAAPDGPLGRALANAIAAAADVTFRDLVRETIRRRDELTDWVLIAGGVPEALAQLSESLGIDHADSLERVNTEIVTGSLFKPTVWSAMAAAIAEGGKSDKEQAGRFASLVRQTDEQRRDTLLEIFCTKDRKPRERIVSAGVQKSHPAIYQRLLAEQQRIAGLMDRLRAIAARARTTALVTIAHEVTARYRAEKDRRGLLDYDDLIDKAQALLETVSSAWVHYKLDRGIDHVLIDEAQDTSPKQWAIVRALVAEFFAGEGARDVNRTMFVVGDEKQSIFSFQGAVPSEFSENRAYFQWAHDRASLSFLPTEFKHSFRSGETVLAAVDTVFARVEAYEGLSQDAAGTAHESLPGAAPGLVEIWDTEKPDDKKELEGWDAPFDETSESSPQARLAVRIAKHVRLWQRQGRRPGEVLILVRRRGALFEGIIRALKHEAVGAGDRLVLTEHIAVMDLMALADTVLLPDDDLALATVLKSPLFGLDEDALFALAYERRTSLRNVLRGRHPELSAKLDRIAAAARSQSPFGFFADLLGAGGARRAILARLGHEADDALSEFLNLALEYERNETPSLQGFMAWLRAARSEVKRDMEMARDEVRVMTVHGAKGLEAPIVILADTTTPPNGFHPPRLLSLVPVDAPLGTPGRLVWAGRQANDVPAMAAAREQELAANREEYRRLLYVAMTRAIDRLIVCGTDGERKRPEGCWYDLVADALSPHCVREPADDGGTEVLRFRKGPAQPAIAPERSPPAAPIMTPDWIGTKVMDEPSRAPAIRPSEAGVDDAAIAESFTGTGLGRPYALLRGTIVHRLLQALPDIVPTRRVEAARRFLARHDPFTEYEREQLTREVLTLIDDPRFGALFAPGSRAEVSLAGRIGNRSLSGQVDRLAVTPEAVVIADFKTNRPAPQNLNEAMRRYPDYVAQLGLYRAVLMKLYPDRPVRAALVWTDTLTMMEIPPEALDSAVAELTAA